MTAQPAQTIVDPAGTGMPDPNLQAFVPSLDNECFTDTVGNLFEQGHFHKEVDVMAGFTKVEGYMLGKLMAPGFNQPGFNISQFR